jgi:S-formylglutathione hydrolase FrmB
MHRTLWFLRRATLCATLIAALTAVFAMAQPASRAECATFESKILARAVPYCVMLPPSYRQQLQRRYPVAYYLHGLGDNEQSLVNLGGWSIYDRLMREKKIGEMVVIAPAGFFSFYINSRDGQLRYEDFFFREFLPAMEKKYRVATTRAQRGLLGVSMGGYGALHYAFEHPERFAAVAANMPALVEKMPREFNQEWQRRLMGHIFGDPPDQAYFERNSVFHLARTAPPESLRTLRIYFDCGAQDRYGFTAGTTALDKLLTSRGIPHEAHIYPGGHDWQFVMDHFGASLTVVAKGIGAR